MIGARSRGTPRIANRLLKRVRDYVEYKGKSIIDDELTELVGTTSLEFVPTIRKSFRCLCASSWELGGSDQTAMHNAIKALIDGNDGSSYWTSLIVAAKNTLPSYMGSEGLCAALSLAGSALRGQPPA